MPTAPRSPACCADSVVKAHIPRISSPGKFAGEGLTLFSSAVVFAAVLVLFTTSAAYLSVRLLREEFQISSHKLGVELLSRQLAHTIDQRLRIIRTLAAVMPPRIRCIGSTIITT